VEGEMEAVVLQRGLGIVKIDVSLRDLFKLKQVHFSTKERGVFVSFTRNSRDW